jgi:hypothetical protein
MYIQYKDLKGKSFRMGRIFYRWFWLQGTVRPPTPVQLFGDESFFSLACQVLADPNKSPNG